MTSHDHITAAGEQVRFAFYGRCSTEDLQDPETSYGWQRRAAVMLTQQHGSVVEDFFDIGYSRSLPWKRRPEALRLLQAMTREDRTFDAVVIGEPQRAFYGSQFASTYPLLQHYGVDLWVPDVGGRLDPSSDIHDLMMTIFGGMSKAERRRIQKRVVGAMEAATINQGRFLGGRPPYGYVIAGAGPHPNPNKAAEGRMLHVLDVDPDAAPVVQRIFELYLQGTGFRSIAAALNRDEVPCPSAHDPSRNTHRAGDGWQPSTVRAILTNPRYVGHEVWGRSQRIERLMDPTDVAAGTLTVFRKSDPERVVTSIRASHPALISADVFNRVQQLLAAGSSSAITRPRAVRPTPTPYQLRGILHCGLCGRRMAGHRLRGSLYYRCRAADVVPSQRSGHPPTVYLREDRVVPPLDEWLSGYFQPERLDETVDALLGSEQPSLADQTRRDAVARRITDAETRIARFKSALAQGVDAVLVGQWITEAVSDLEQARSASAALPVEEHRDLARDDLLALVTDMSLLMQRLSDADPDDKAALYAALGLHLTYDHVAGALTAEIRTAQEWVNQRVRGGT